MRAPVQQPEAARAIMNAAQESPPGLFVGEGSAGRARGKHIRGQLPRINLRNPPGQTVGSEPLARLRHSLRAHRLRATHLRIPHPRQLNLTPRIIRQTEHIRRKHRELPDHLRRMRRRQKTDLPRNEAGREPHREPVAIRADVEHMVAGRQRCRDPRHIRKEFPRDNRNARTVRTYRIRLRVRDQRKRGAQAATLSCAR